MTIEFGRVVSVVVGCAADPGRVLVLPGPDLVERDILLHVISPTCTSPSGPTWGYWAGGGVKLRERG
jgi:hypothetical protein